MKKLLENLFDVVTLDNDVILTYCSLYRKLRETGKGIGDADLLIAASAISKNLVFWTEDLKHFERLEGLGLKLKK